MLIYALVHFHVIRHKDSWTTYTVEDVANGIQAFLMCLEMLIAAIAHSYAFPVSDYVPPPGAPRPKFGDNVKEMFNISDVAGDIAVLFGCLTGPPPPAEVAGKMDVEGGAPAAELAAAKAEARVARRARREAEAAAEGEWAYEEEGDEAPPPLARWPQRLPLPAPSAAPARSAGGAAADPLQPLAAAVTQAVALLGACGFGRPSAPYPYGDRHVGGAGGVDAAAPGREGELELGRAARDLEEAAAAQAAARSPRAPRAQRSASRSSGGTDAL
jgi:hypothetical protein